MSEFVTKEFFTEEVVTDTDKFTLTSVSVTVNGPALGGTAPITKRRQWWRQYKLRCVSKNHAFGREDYWSPREKISGPNAPKKTELPDYPCPKCDPRPLMDCPCCCCPTVPAKEFARDPEGEGDDEPVWRWDDSQRETCGECGCTIGIEIYDDDPPLARAVIRTECGPVACLGCGGTECPEGECKHGKQGGA